MNFVYLVNEIFFSVWANIGANFFKCFINPYTTKINMHQNQNVILDFHVINR